MSTFAVIGGDTPLGRRIVAGLRDDARVTRLVVLGARVEPEPGIDAHAVDLAAADLKPYLDGVDTIIECATRVDPMPERDLLDRMTTQTASNVLRSAAGATRYVVVSSTAVYGAWDNNPVPVTEDALVRPNPGFDPATRAAEIERRVRDWQTEHPDCSVAIVRTAPIVAPDGSDLMALLLAGRPPIVARGADPTIQVAHVDDVAAGVVCVAMTDATGVMNVAAPGAITNADVAALLPGRKQFPVPEELLARALDALWQPGAGDVPSSALPYLRAPLVVDTRRLESLGWEAQYSNEAAITDCLSESVYTLPPQATRALVAAGVTAGVVFGAGFVWWRRRVKRRRRARH